MRRAWPAVVPLVVALALGGVAGRAHAQGISRSVVTFGAAGPAKVLTEPAVLDGELVVSFRGDVAAGCGAYGVCAYSGTVVVRPGSGSLSIVTYRLGGRTGRQAMLALNGFGNGLTTSARVQRSTPGGQAGTCADGESAGFGGTSGATIHGRSLTIRLLATGGSLLQTRCAGPLDGDLASAVRSVTLPLARAVRGRATLDFTGTRTFAAHGFAGTVTSTVVMRLGKSRAEPLSSTPSFPPGIRVERVRTVSQELSLVGLRGGMTAAVQGTSDPIVCRLLDSCGLNGILSLERGPQGGVARVVAQVVASGSASRPYGDFLTALGLGHGGRARGITVAVFVTLNGGVRARISQNAATCADAAPGAGVSAIIGVASGSTAFGFPGASAGFTVGPWRTRCPGPDLANSLGTLAASLVRGAPGSGDVAVELRGKGSFTDDGYVVSPQGRLSIVLRRGRIHQQVSVQPVA